MTDVINLFVGRWSSEELAFINVLQLRAFQIDILIYCEKENNGNVKIMSSDNSIAIEYVNDKGIMQSYRCFFPRNLMRTLDGN